MRPDIPEDVRERWAAKAETLKDVALPYGSATSLSLAGQSSDLDLASALQLLITLYPDEVPLDGGAGKCKQLDSAIYDDYVAETGNRPRGVSAMEAVWLATDEALYYISPRVGRHLRWAWEEVTIRPIKQRRQFSRVLIATEDDTFEMGLGTAAMANLLTIQSWSKSRQ